jgi:electron transfer flavoprotein beta subunit
LAASDTLATSYALTKVIQHMAKDLPGGVPDLIFCGLQTTDGDTAQVGPEIAERLNVPQITYCEDFSITDGTLSARRIVEGGYAVVESPLPALMTVANAYTPLAYKSLRGAQFAQHLSRNAEAEEEIISVIDLDTVDADPMLCGLKGSPTIVGKTWKIGEVGGSCQIYQGQAVKEMVAKALSVTDIATFTGQPTAAAV